MPDLYRKPDFVPEGKGHHPGWAPDPARGVRQGEPTSVLLEEVHP